MVGGGELGGWRTVVGYEYWVGEGVLGGVGVVDDQHRSENLRIFCIEAAGRQADCVQTATAPVLLMLALGAHFFINRTICGT